MTVRDTPWAPGTPCWVDLMTTDVEAAAQFYGSLFGWNLTDTGEEGGHYRLADVGGKQVAGLGPMQPGMEHPSVWTTYLATEDVDATVAKIQAAGGTVVAPAMDVMDIGRMAVAQDPTGATFSVWQAGKHIGVELANESNTLTWNELVTRDYEASKAFYGEVFGYTFSEMGDGGMHYAFIEVNGTGVGGIGDMPEGVPAQVPSHWRLYFAVEDTDKMVERASELGGTVLSPPQDMPYGRWADVADGQGASFSLLKPPAEAPSAG